MDHKRKLMLKSQSIARLCKDLKYYESELAQHQSRRNDASLDDEEHRQADKFIIESTRTIDHVQSSLESILDEFEAALGVYLNEYGEDLVSLEKCDVYALAKRTYQGLEEYGVEVDMSIFPH